MTDKMSFLEKKKQFGRNFALDEANNTQSVAILVVKKD